MMGEVAQITLPSEEFSVRSPRLKRMKYTEKPVAPARANHPQSFNERGRLIPVASPIASSTAAAIAQRIKPRLKEDI